MARTIDEIQAQIVTNIQSTPALSGLTTTSVTGIWLLITRVVAAAIWVLETLFDYHVADVNTLVALNKPHTSHWYQRMSLNFQYGSALVAGEDYYDNSLLTDDQIAAQKVIATAAAQDVNGILKLKVSRFDTGVLKPLTNDQLTAFSTYINEIKDAGVRVQVTSVWADQLRMNVDIYYDPSVLNSSGARIDGTSSTPVKDAINKYLMNLPYDGLFVKAHLVDAIQAVEGVWVPEILMAVTAPAGGTSFIGFDIYYQPVAGYLRIYNPSDLYINYIPHN